MRAAITRKPAPSNRRYTSPIKLRPTPSGFTMERVRSIAILTSGAGMENPPQWGPTKTAKCTGEGLSKQSRRVPKPLYYLEKGAITGTRTASRSNVEAFAAAALALGLGILELERLVQTLLHEVHQRTVDQREAGPVDHHLDSARLEYRVFRANFVGIIHYVRKSGTSGLLDADTQADPRPPLLQRRTDPISRRFRQQYCHTTPPLVH